jgi:hypothetical protein
LFEPDVDVTWRSRHDRRYLAVRRKGHPDEVFLLGTDQALAMFERFPRQDPESWLVFLSFARDRPWSPEEGKRTRAELLKHSWRPGFFRE